jgi:5'-methylthioadenosine phosphorylase
MTNMPEAKLAREAEISYATLALATDYDCWHEGEEDVTVEGVIAVVQKNAARARQVLANAVALVPARHECIAARALDGAIMTDPAVIPAATKARLAPIIGKYLP